jgi:NAD(P)-dependent dehydrogenase (short-subunit alcohol dehydrogenase family)
LATVELLRASGASCVVVDRDSAADITADISSAAGCEKAISGAADSLGGIDALFISAGGGSYASIEKTDEELWHRTLALNLVAAGLLTKAALPALRNSKRASVLVTASAAGRQGYPAFSAYSSANAGLIHWARGVARELGPSGIRVNSISPGPIDTPMLRSGAPADTDLEEWKTELASRTCLGRVGTAQEVANLAAFLISDLASFVSGTNIEIDGGETA